MIALFERAKRELPRVSCRKVEGIGEATMHLRLCPELGFPHGHDQVHLASPFRAIYIRLAPALDVLIGGERAARNPDEVGGSTIDDAEDRVFEVQE